MIQFTVEGNPVPKARPRFRIMQNKAYGEAMRALDLEITQNRFTARQVFSKMRLLFKDANFVSTYTPPPTVAYEAKISMVAKRAMAGRFPSSAPIEIMIELRMQIPVSWTKKKRLAASTGAVRATKKPDSGNVQKAIEDAMNGIVYVDDSQIVTTTVRKIYHAEPCMIVAVREVEGEAA
jgi:Holliday junction resolvase RusA-like endonuclease